jgi:hypothetical protein
MIDIQSLMSIIDETPPVRHVGIPYDFDWIANVLI